MFNIRQLAFLLPVAGKPEQCFDEITPNDMKSSGMCAASGAFLLFGGWGAVIWVFLRALSLHLQICWEVIPGNKFFLSSLVFGWLIPVIGLATALALTGVSFRFGNVCHINHKLALQDFWGPLLAFAAIGMVLQFITLGYCIHVYVKSLMDSKSNTTNTSSNMQSYSGSVTTRTARQTFRRVKRVVELQWRGACIVLLIIGEVAFFSVVFVSMDNSFQLSDELIKKASPWLTCLATPGKTKQDCLPLIGDITQSEGLVLAVLICLGVSQSLRLVTDHSADYISVKWILVRRLLRPLVNGARMERSVPAQTAQKERIRLSRCSQDRCPYVRNVEWKPTAAESQSPRSYLSESYHSELGRLVT